ncbi:hypothetical protein HYN49_07755 [Flavobacterium pallidum]|uniref:Uncharacterized protein n=1 Tax=Flavobacterium pallidum TaxID=2172098 RepID=A0A2S1SHB3_9FLAO|nr:hypothetical protein HYN49_07755 [Flavobacterium pallidum]
MTGPVASFPNHKLSFFIHNTGPNGILYFCLKQSNSTMKAQHTYNGFEAYEHLMVISANEDHNEDVNATPHSFEDWDLFFPDTAF